MENISAMATVRFLPMFTFSTSGVCLADIMATSSIKTDIDGSGKRAWDYRLRPMWQVVGSRDRYAKMHWRWQRWGGYMWSSSRTIRHPMHGTSTRNNPTQTMGDIIYWNIILILDIDASDSGEQRLETVTCMLCHSAMATLVDVWVSNLSTKYMLTRFNFFQFCEREKTERTRLR